MAFPTTISGVKIRQPHSGPFLSSGDNVYFIGYDPTTSLDAQLVAVKATDPASSFAEQDSGNRPTMGASAASVIINISIKQVGDLLHIITFNVVKEVYYARYNMATDTWVDVDTGDKDIEVVAASDNQAGGVDIEILSSGKIRVIFGGPYHKDMGSSYFSTHETNSTDDGVTWSTAVEIDPGGGGHFRPAGIILPPDNSDQCIIFFIEAISGTNLWLRGIASDNTLRTERDTGLPIPSTPFTGASGIGVVRSSTSIVRFPYFHGPSGIDRTCNFNAFSDDTNPSISSVEFGIDVSSFDIAALGSELHLIAVDRSTDDVVYKKDNDTDSWDSPIKK